MLHLSSQCYFLTRRGQMRMWRECVGLTWTTWRTSSPSSASASSTSSPTLPSTLPSSSSGCTCLPILYSWLFAKLFIVHIWNIQFSSQINRLWISTKIITLARTIQMKLSSIFLLVSIWNFLHLKETVCWHWCLWPSPLCCVIIHVRLGHDCIPAFWSPPTLSQFQDPPAWFFCLPWKIMITFFRTFAACRIIHSIVYLLVIPQVPQTLKFNPQYGIT